LNPCLGQDRTHFRGRSHFPWNSKRKRPELGKARAVWANAQNKGTQVRNYTTKKKRARKKRILARKEPKKRKRPAKKAAAKKRVVKKSAAKKRSAKKPAAKKRSAKKPAAKKRSAKKPAAKKRNAKKVAAKKRVVKKAAAKKRVVKRARPVRRATQKTPAKKRGVKNAKLRAKVAKAEKLREKSRRKKITPAQRKAAREKAALERHHVEQQRLFDERLRQHQEEQQRLKASKRAVLTKLQERFEPLLNEAKRTGQLPRVPRGRRLRRIKSKKMVGQKVNILIDEMLLPESVEEILYRVKQETKRMDDIAGFGWLGVVNFAGLGESLLGYGQIILSSTLPGASLFQTQGIESTGIRNSKQGMFTALEDKLEYLAGDDTTMIYANFITISSYVLRR
jgi:hypothetical protein